jgi:hypothetical protein
VVIDSSGDWWRGTESGDIDEYLAYYRGGGNETFEMAVGFAALADGDVRWVSIGLRCVGDGILGVYTDWKIDYSPTAHLFDRV